MKANASQIAKALDAPDGKIRFFLLHGPDDSGSRALSARLDRAMGAGAERIELDGATLKDDPARLADEAAAISLFGDRRHICVTGGEECLPAVIALLESTVAGDPAVMITGALKPASALLKRALADPAVLAFASYKPEGAKADEVAVMLGRSQGLRLTRSAARELAANCLGDRAIMAREAEKMALFLDAAPDRPRDADSDTLEAIGAGLAESDMSALVDAVMDGRLPVVAEELATMAETTSSPIPALRALSRRLLLLARLRAQVDNGQSVGHVISTVGKSLFYRDKDKIEGQLGRWRSERLRIAARRVFAAENAIKARHGPGDVIAADELVAIARVAARLR